MDSRRQRAEATPRDPLLERVQKATHGLFELRRAIGRGPIAAVYCARDVRLDRMVALKVVFPDVLAAKGVAERIRLAARPAMALDHPNIAAMHAVEELDGLVILVSRFVEGASLEAILRFEPTLAIPAVQSVLSQAGAALDYAHDEGVVHGGVKPSNVIVTLAGDAVVTDFGFAHALAARGGHTGASPHSPTYLSPEQIRGGSVYASSDQYSLGVVAYEMLVGKPPFGGTIADVRNAHLNKKPAAISNPEVDIPPELASAVARMLAKTPSERFPSLGDAIVELAQGMGDYEDSPRGPLSWLAQQNMPREAGEGSRTAPRGWRRIPLTPLPLLSADLSDKSVETPSAPVPVSPAPAIKRAPGPAPQQEMPFAPAAKVATKALIAAAAAPAAPLVAIPAAVPAAAPPPGAAPRAPTPRQAQRAAADEAGTRRRRRYLTVGLATVAVGGLATWQTLAGRTPLRSVAVAVSPAQIPPPADTSPVPALAASPSASAGTSGGEPSRVEPFASKGVRSKLPPVSKAPPSKGPTTKTAPAKLPPATALKVVPNAAATKVASVKDATPPAKAANPPAPASGPASPPPPVVASVAISGERRELVAGEMMRLQARVTDTQNQVMQRLVTWRSSNPDVAEVDGAGLVIAKRRGSVRITASIESRSDDVQVDVKDAEPATPPPVASAPPPRTEAPRPSPRLSDGEAERVARGVADRVRNDVDGLASAMAGSKADRDFVAWLRKKPLDLQVGSAQGASVAQQADGTARVTYSVPISWTHASGARPVRTATFSVVVGGVGASARVASWSLSSPFAP